MAGINYLSIANIDLGKINRWQSSKAASITPISFPGEDANLTEGVDTLGIIAYYTIGGRIVNTFETLQHTIYLIRCILDGAQTSSSVLRSPFVNAKVGQTSTRVQGHIGTNTHYLLNSIKDTTVDFNAMGIDTPDKVKNLTTGGVYDITLVTDEFLELDTVADPFPTSGIPYAVTASMNIKILSLDIIWNLPGLAFVDYTLSVMQVL